MTYINEKGGVGKTSICYNTAWQLASEGTRILMIDIDGQKANLTFFSGVDKLTGMKTMIDVLKNGCSLENAAVKVKDNLWIVPADAAVSDIGMDAKVSRFRRELQKVEELYDYIFIDVTPSPGWSHYLSLSVSDYAIVIMLPDIASLEGNSGILESIQEIQETTNSTLEIAGILFNRNNDRTTLSHRVREVVERMADDAGTVIFKSKIPQAISLSECVAAHVGITDYDSGSKAAEAIIAFSKELKMKI